MEKKYGVRYYTFTKSGEGRIVEKYFSTQKALDRAIAKIEADGNYNPDYGFEFCYPNNQKQSKD